MIYRTTVLAKHLPAKIGAMLFVEHPEHEPYSLRQAAGLIAEQLGQEAAWLRVYQALQAAGHLPKSIGGRIAGVTPALASRFLIGLMTNAAGHLKADGCQSNGDQPGPPALLSEILERCLGSGLTPFEEVEFCPSQGWAMMRSADQRDRIFLLA